MGLEHMWARSMIQTLHFDSQPYIYIKDCAFSIKFDFKRLVNYLLTGFPYPKRFIFIFGWVRAHFLGYKLDAPGARVPNQKELNFYALNEVDYDIFPGNETAVKRQWVVTFHVWTKLQHKQGEAWPRSIHRLLGTPVNS